MTGDPKNERRVREFAEVAARYCSWVESEPGDPHEEMHTIRKLLAELHIAGLQIPDLGLGEEVERTLKHIDYKTVKNRFEGLPVIGYWDVFDPLVGEEPVYNELPDDLADIYVDLKNGQIFYDRGQTVEAVWDWRFHFEIHWGAHLTGAQRAIHSYCSGDI